jgi:hypothetical protein
MYSGTSDLGKAVSIIFNQKMTLLTEIIRFLENLANYFSSHFVQKHIPVGNKRKSDNSISRLKNTKEGESFAVGERIGL